MSQSEYVHDVPADPATPAPDGGEPGAANLDKVRDILFGVQLRDVDRRFARIEERLAKETADLRDDMRRRLSALEQYIKGEVEALSVRLKSENEQRHEALTGMGRDVREIASGLERRASNLQEEMERGQRDLRQHSLEQHQRLSDDLSRRTDEVLAALAREAQELRGAKTDRAALASLLTEMAMRLTNDFKLPSGEGTGNA